MQFDHTFNSLHNVIKLTFKNVHYFIFVVKIFLSGVKIERLFSLKFTTTYTLLPTLTKVF